MAGSSSMAMALAMTGSGSNSKSRLLTLLALWSFIILVDCTMASQGKTGPTHDKVVVCYISTWAVYRPGNGAYSIENFDANLCTHAVYAFAGLDITQWAIKSLDPWQDLTDNYGKGGFKRLTALKERYPHLKVNLAIGGWNEGSKNYSLLVANAELRGRFVRQVTDFVQKYNFDGLDLDWEYPTQRGGKPEDYTNFALLVRELREEFDKHSLLLTSAIGAAKHVIDQAYDVRVLSRYLHFLHIMCYDYHGAWDNQIGYNAPLHSTKPGDVLSVQYTIDYLLEKGASPSKIVLGLPFYGRTFQTPLQPQPDNAAEGTGFQGPFTREDGFLGYNEICLLLSNKTAGWTTHWNAATDQVLANSERDPLTGQTRVVTYDNARSIANKVRFAMSRQLAGLMIWAVDTDDFRGDCDDAEEAYFDYKYLIDAGTVMPRRSSRNYPLLHTINEAVPLALQDIALEKRAPPSQDGKQPLPPPVTPPEHDHDHDTHDVSDNEIPHGGIEDRKASVGGASVSSSISNAVLLFSFTLLLMLLPRSC